jgi:hypothetical protein
MKKQILILVFLINFLSIQAANRYVSGIGNDNSNGLSPSTAYRNLQKAADIIQAGDTVFAMNGIYTNQYPGGDVVNINKSGTALKWIVFINYPNHSPKIQFNGWGGFKMEPMAAYIEVNGFDIEGNNNNVTLDQALNQSQSCNNPGGDFQPEFNGNGISADGRNGTPTQRPHHFRFINNKIHDCGGAGIGIVQADYVVIRNNLVYNNAWYTIFGSSGISLYQNWNSDNNTTDFKNIIENNICHHNRLYVPWVYAPCEIYDGNGIIIDDFNNSQNNSDLGIYSGKTLIQNNVLYMNGGSGAHTYESQHVTIRHNTAYRNSQSVETTGGEIFANASNDCKITNNILYAEDNNPINTNYNNQNLTYLNNLHWNGTTTALSNMSCKVANPLFVNETEFDFHLLANSPCIDKANNLNSPDVDFEGIPRPQGTSSDIGAYEYLYIDALPALAFNDEEQIYPNPTKGEVYFNNEMQNVKIACINVLGQKSTLKEEGNKIDLSAKPAGLYKLIFYKKDGGVEIFSILKK